MSITAKDVKHIATLSRLNVPADELEKFEDQFNQILNYAEILKQVDTNLLLMSFRRAMSSVKMCPKKGSPTRTP